MDLIDVKLLKRQNNISGAEEDRISLLPDSLIHHILSFIDTKCVARTSLLSHRWSHIWTSIPTLDFQFSNFENSSNTIIFIDFVDRTLLLHDFSNINKFSLRWRCWCSNQLNLNSSKINSWISAVIRHNVEEIRLVLHHEQEVPISLPLSLFTCRSLVTLELNISPNICLPKYISFPRLKRLLIDDFKFNDDSWNQQLFSNCPMLEDLVLEDCTYPTDFCISIPSLKLFIFKNFGEKEDCLRDCSLRIHLPSLVSLTCWGSVPKEFILSTFPTLVEADVAFSVDHRDTYVPTRVERIVHAAALRTFLGALTHVKHLSVCEETLQTLFFADDRSNNLPTFHNVKQLTITSEVDTDEVLIAIFKATPNLESLVFDRLITPLWTEEDYSGSNDAASDDDHVGNDEGQNNPDNKDDDSVTAEGKHHCATKDNGWELDMVNMVNTGCLFLHLESVCFGQFIGKPREMRWVKLILKNAKPLKTMIISYGTDTAVCFSKPKSKEEVMVEISSFPRASSSCTFEFSSYKYAFIYDDPDSDTEA